MGLHNHRLVLLRHGETEWSKSGQHTGRTDIELTDTGRLQAELAGRVLRELNLTDPLVISSPRIRALTTAKLAGLPVDGGRVAQVSDRADRAVALALEHMTSRDVVFVGHSHFSRSVITRWVELPLVEGSRFWMLAGSIAVCGFEHGVRQLAALGLTGLPQAIAPG